MTGYGRHLSWKHKWVFDWPWEMVNLKDWFYMVNVGSILPVIFLHVRILGVRSIWEIEEVHNEGKVQ